MSDLHLNAPPVAKTAMLIRRPVAEVFDAFINPNITTQFWFTKSTGGLEAGEKVEWSWEMYDFSIEVQVKAVELNRRIQIEWPGLHDITRVEWTFNVVSNEATFVEITNEGFTGTGDECVKQALDSVSGFSLVLAALKAFLEHKIRLTVVADRFPRGIHTH